MAADRPVVVALGQVDPDLVAGVFGDGVSFVPDPGPGDLAVAAGAIARADAVVNAAFLDRAPRLRVVARTGSGSTWSTWRRPAPAGSPSWSRPAAAPGPSPKASSRWPCTWSSGWGL